MKTRVSSIGESHDCHWKQLFAFSLPQAPSNLIFFDNFANSKAFHTVPKLVLLNKYVSDLFTEVNVWSRTYFQKNIVNFRQNMTSFNKWNRHKKQKKISQTIMVIIFWDLMNDQISLSPQVERSVLPHQLRNNLRLSILGN